VGKDKLAKGVKGVVEKLAKKERFYMVIL